MRLLTVRTAALLAMMCLSARAEKVEAQIRVSPTGVSTNAMAATTVFLTFAGLRNQTAVEAFWCGEIVAATSPDRGVRCDPATVYGRLPLRSDRSSLSAAGVLTDLMSIPASVARRAFQDAQRGQRGTFFYVRRFASTTGGPDEFVAVTCRLTGGGANVPFALTNVTVSFTSAAPIEFVQAGDAPPPIAAQIAYNGTGRLRGRWEIVMPGDERPSDIDLLTEASLPAEQRGRQRRYAQLERFNVLLPPGGPYTLQGPDPSRLPTASDGAYLVLLRIEATDDRAGDSDPGASGPLLHNGAVAGFPMPVLRYLVGSVAPTPEPAGTDRTLRLLSPRANATLAADSALIVHWSADASASYSRVEFQTRDGTVLLSSVVRRGGTRYRVPPMLADRAAGQTIRWRVSTLGATGNVIRRTAWRELTISANAKGPS